MVGFVSEVVTVAEDGGNAVLTVELTGAAQRNVTVRFTTNPNAALGKKNTQIYVLTDNYLQLPVITLQHWWT